MGAEVVGVRNLAAAAGKLDIGLKGVKDQALLAEKALGSIKGSIPAGGLGIEKELIAANAEAVRLESRLNAMRWSRVPGGGGVIPPMLPPGGGGGGGGGHGGRRGGLHGGNIHAGSHGIGIGGVGMGLADSLMVPAAAGFVAAYVGHQFYESAKDYQDATMRFKALNLGDAVNAEAEKFAHATQAYGVSQTELMSAMAESAGLFNNFDEVKRFTPQLVTLGKANAAIYGDKLGGMDDEGLKSLMKFIDRRGGTKDEASFTRNLNLAERLVTGSGGFLKFQDLGNFSQQGGTAFRSLSDEGLMHMEGLMIEQGGARAATSMMSIYQNLVAGRTPKKTMGLLQDLGLATLQMQEHGSVGGKPMKSLVMTDIQGSSLLQSDPAKWMDEVLLPALAKKGITSQDQVLKVVNDVLSNRTASNQASIMTTQQFQLIRDYKLAQGAMGSDDVIGTYKKSASGAEDNFTAAWTDFKNEFGQHMLPAITDMLNGGTALLRSINSFASDHPDLIKALGTIAAHDGGVVDPGGMIVDLTKQAWSHFTGSKTPGHADSSVASGGGNAGGGTVGDVYLDGKKVGKHVAGYLAQQTGLSTNTGGIDPGVSLPMPGLKY
ncbi:hypothetical protein [Pararobbsia alpina]|nr:hypothetical protein [Pararobbsia alpina]